MVLWDVSLSHKTGQEKSTKENISVAMFYFKKAESEN